MSIGIAGDNQESLGLANPLPSSVLVLIELRVISTLLQNLLGSDQTNDELSKLRNDAAFDLGITTPVPGS